MDLFAKAAELGLQTDFIDGYGRPHRIDAAALAQVLDALPDPPSHALFQSLPVIRAGEPGSTTLTPHAAIPAGWTVSAAGQVIAKGTSQARIIAWPEDLPSGVYELQITDAEKHRENAPLVAAPPSCFAGDFERSWLIAVQLYSVHSNRNWGIGDFTDLDALVRFAAEAGADGIGLNPLHALFDDRPGDCSPYSPNSRQFLNPLYIDVAKLPGVALTAEIGAELQRLRGETLVDYAGVAAVKQRALRQAFAAFSGSDPDFEAFRAERGATLKRFACFETLRHHHKTPWWVWDDWQSADEAQVAAL